MTTEPLVYTVDEVARLLRCGRRQCYEMIRRGELPGVLHLGSRSIRVSAVALLKFTAGSDGNGGQQPHGGGAVPDEDAEE